MFQHFLHFLVFSFGPRLAVQRAPESSELTLVLKNYPLALCSRTNHDYVKGPKGLPGIDAGSAVCKTKTFSSPP